MAGWHPSKRQRLPGNEVLWRACVQLQMIVRVTQSARALELSWGGVTDSPSGNLTLAHSKRGACVKSVQSLAAPIVFSTTSNPKLRNCRIVSYTPMAGLWFATSPLLGQFPKLDVQCLLASFLTPCFNVSLGMMPC